MNNSGFQTTGSITHDPNRREQYIVVGVNRGGTSAIAASLHALGLELGENVHETTFEHIDLAQAVRSRKWRHFKELIADAERSSAKFAWKFPSSNMHLKKVHSYFSNPYYIFVYRDLFAIANRKSVTLDLDMTDALQENLDAYQRIVSFVKRYKPRALHVSYEKLLLNPREYALALAGFCDVEPTEERLERISATIEVSPESYNRWCRRTRSSRLFREEGYDGCVDHLGPDAVSGWIVRTGRDVPLQVELFVNDTLIGEYCCDLHRPDLITAGKSTSGRAGFRIALPKGCLNSGDRVDIWPKDAKAPLSVSMH